MESKRKQNWSDGEITTLVESVSNALTLIKGKFSPFITKEKKEACWKSITIRVNAVNGGGCVRTTSEVRKKWQDVQSDTKKKEATRLKAARLTGGGPAPDDSLKPWEQIVAATLTKAVVCGVDGGVDTAAEFTQKDAVPQETEEPVPSGTSTCVSPNRAFSYCEETICISPCRSNPAVALAESNKSVGYPGASSQHDKRNCKRKANQDTHIAMEEQYLAMESEKLSDIRKFHEKMIKLEEKKVLLQERSTVALEKVANAMQNYCMFSSNFTDTISVSPIINLNHTADKYN